MGLGQNKKGTKRRRSRFHPSEYRGGPVYTEEAYGELSRSAFAVWIRLMTLTGDQLREGIGSVSRRLGYSPKGGRAVLSELELAGYVGFVNEGTRQHVVLLRKAMVELRGTSFIRTR
jgi:hypothetical protein